MIRELQEAFRSHPVYEKITITNKYQLDEKTKYGLIVKNSNAEQLKLSADNFLGTVYSRVALANLAGNAIEWVREDSANLLREAMDDVSDQADGENTLFELQHQHIMGVEKLSSSIVEISASDVEAVSVFVDGVRVRVLEINPAEGLVKLATPPEEGALVKIGYYWLNIAPVGAYGVEIVSPNTFMVDPIIYKKPFKINLSNAKSAKIYISESLPFAVFSDLNIYAGTTLVPSSNYEIDPSTRTIQFTAKPQGGNLSIRRVSTDTLLQAGVDYFITVRQASELLARRTSGIEKILDLEFDTVIPDTLEIWIDNEKVVNAADDTDVFSPDKITYTLVDGYKVTFSTSLPESKRVMASYYYRDKQVRDSIPLVEVFDDSLRVILPDSGIIPKSVDVYVKGDLVPHDKFVFDSETNDLVLYDSFSNEEVKVSYYYALESQGPFEFEVFGYNNTAIPGCILSFARQGEVGAKQMVFISDTPEVTALEYGGKFNTSFSLDVVALDPIQQEEITDLVAMYLLSLKEKFDSEGLFLETVSIQGESEEPYDENTTDQYYLASISVAFVTDWHIRKNVPVKIRDTYVRLVASVYNNVDVLKTFTAPDLYPKIESPVLFSERIG